MWALCLFGSHSTLLGPGWLREDVTCQLGFFPVCREADGCDCRLARTLLHVFLPCFLAFSYTAQGIVMPQHKGL